MSENKLLTAYRHLFDVARDSAIKTDLATWKSLADAIDSADSKATQLSLLTSQEFNQVQTDLKADLNEVAEFLTHAQQTVSDFVSMEWPILEGFLAEQAKDAADPTTVMVLRMRMMAAMDKNIS